MNFHVHLLFVVIYVGSQYSDYANQLNGLSGQLDGMTIYKTTPYSGITTAPTTIATATLQKGKYLVFSSGYSSLYGAYIRNVGYVDATAVIDVTTPTTYNIASASSSQETWTRYIVNFLKIK